jgi:hypothetical protein
MSQILSDLKRFCRSRRGRVLQVSYGTRSCHKLEITNSHCPRIEIIAFLNEHLVPQ